MAITQAMCTSFKKELLEATHDFRTTGDTFQMALYIAAATLNASTTVYNPANEASGTGYSVGGQALTNTNPSVAGTKGITDFADVTWGSSTITARGALIFNSSKTNKAVAVLDFGSDFSSSNGDFVVQFPAATEADAIIRIA